MSEVLEIPDSHDDEPDRTFDIFNPVFIAKFLLGIFLYATVMAIFNTVFEKNETQVGDVIETIAPFVQPEVVLTNSTEQMKTKIVIQPSCPTVHHQTIIQELCEDYILKLLYCTPDDYDNLKKHQIPINFTTVHQVEDPRSNIVEFLTAGLLMVSLMAAFLELYKAKKQTTAKTKAPLTRKCSLADLTIMKHQRKELLRRDSILEAPEETKPVTYRKPPPLQRSSSTPIESISDAAPVKMLNRSFDSRRNSVIDGQQFPNFSAEPSNLRLGMDAKRGSIFESRKVSIIDGKFVDKYDTSGRRFSVDITSSPERKHYSRLVHRH